MLGGNRLSNNKSILGVGKIFNLGLYEKAMPNTLSLEEKLTEAKSAGFDFLEISIDESVEKQKRLKWSFTQRENLVGAMWKTGTKILTMCLSAHRKYPIGSEKGSIRDKGIEVMTDAINLAQDIGIRIIQIAGYDEYYNPSTETTKKYFFNNLELLVNYAASRGVVLAFETMETDFMNTVGKAMVYVKKVNSPFLQIYPDIGNITNAALMYGNNLEQDLEKGSGHIAAMHMKETVPGKFREIPFGNGHVDFTSAFNHVYKMNVRLFVGEFWYTGNRNWREDLRTANTFLRSKMVKKLGKNNGS